VKTRDTFSYAFGAIRLRKLRAGLTTLGIVIGIAAIVALMSFTQGFQVALNSQFEKGFATDTLLVSTRSGGLAAIFGGTSSSDFSLYTNDTMLIDNLSSVQTSAAAITKGCSVVKGNWTTTLSVTGVNFTTYKSIYSTFSAEYGQIPDKPNNDSVVVGYSLHDPYKNGTILLDVGDAVVLSYNVRNGTKLVQLNRTMEVVGILGEIGGFGMGPMDSGVYIPIDTARDFFATSVANQIIVKLTGSDSSTIDAVTKEILSLYSNEVTVTSPTALLSTISSILGTVSLLLAGIAGISLLVAGVGIMNIMIVSLMERTREIGILKALGAKGRTVMAIFLGESLIVGIIGATVGIVLGSLIANLISIGLAGGGGFSSFGGNTFGSSSAASAFSAIKPVLTPYLITMSLAFGIVVSIVFALYPAWRASKLMPVDALRYE
jgi:putative ABC transport system permease protein